MRVAVVTHKLLNNYGGALQAYALQNVLRREGHYVVGIDCVPDPMTFTHFILSNLKTLLLKIGGNRSRKFYSFPHEIRHASFSDFYSKRLVLTERVTKYRRRQLKRLHVDAVIVGSDQVWRSSFHKDRKLYRDMFLEFVGNLPVMRIAYAASFGVSWWELDVEETKIMKRLAGKFNAVSTREGSGVTLCREQLGIKALHVPDPTLLLSWDEYRRISKKSIHRDFTFAYLLDISDYMLENVRTISKDKNMDLIYVSAESNVSIGIEEWLGNIDAASLMITNSFHGTVMAILSHTPFIVIPHRERGEERIKSLLDSLGLENRILTTPDVETNPANNNLIDEVIDWERVDKEIDGLRAKGNLFIRYALSGYDTAEIENLMCQVL